ncbi:MAG: SusD/RagB family nutrient-binding outer membrane lipoprotein, partial [Bacteroidia bacterium]|nr:SusD/RagB family nutrient-binding outer membrane lipoprotein [Bacteroidia bacterium]
YIKMDLMMYSEVEFLLAEAAQRGGFSASDPEGHYKNGIVASLKRWGITDGVNGFSFDTYYNNPKVSYSSAGNTLERIIEQKWISLWLNVESWFSWRATGYPVFIVGPVTQYGAALPLRFMYPVPSQDPKYLVNYNEAVSKLEATSYVPAGQSKDHTYSRMWLLQGTGKPY